MTEEPQPEDRNTPELQAFAEVVRRFCAWAELRDVDLMTELLTARRFLAELQLAFLCIREDPAGNVEPGRISDDQWQKVYDRFEAALPLREYMQVFDPLQEGQIEAVSGDLADDLADIWRDLREGLDLYDCGLYRQAQWHWFIMYETHWGNHLFGAQRAIFAFHAPLNPPEEEKE